MIKTMELSKSKLKAKDLLETMRFCFCADRQAFVSAFAKVGIPIKSEQDLAILKEWHDKGYDTRGEVKNTKGEIVKFNIVEFVNSIKIDHNKLFNCKINFVN